MKNILIEQGDKLHFISIKIDLALQVNGAVVALPISVAETAILDVPAIDPFPVGCAIRIMTGWTAFQIPTISHSLPPLVVSPIAVTVVLW